jgi:hypothetical protein
MAGVLRAGRERINPTCSGLLKYETAGFAAWLTLLLWRRRRENQGGLAKKPD